MIFSLIFITFWWFLISLFIIESTNASCLKENVSIMPYLNVSRKNYITEFKLKEFPPSINCMSKNESLIIDLASFLNQQDKYVYLVLSSTNIVSVEFNTNKNRTSDEIYFDLFLMDHQNRSLTLRSINRVRNIYLDKNQITYFATHENVPKEDLISASYKTNLENLYLESNRLLLLNGSNWFKNAVFQKILYLDLASNQIEEIYSSYFNSLIKLRIIVFQVNNLKIIKANQFDGLQNLEELYLDYNQIHTIEDKAFYGLTRLKRLDLTRNQIRVLNSNAFDNNYRFIEDFYFSKNAIYEFDENFFAKFDQLLQIYVQENKLKAIKKNHFINNTLLYNLGLFSNQIETIEDFAFANCAKLVYMTFNGNKLRSLNKRTLVGLTSLIDLSFEANQIESIEDESFGDLKNVYMLNLASNQLRNISRDTFKGLNNLFYLLLSHNQIEVIDQDAFRPLVKLSGVEMFQNRIKAIEKQNSLFSLSMLGFIGINNNPISKYDAGSFDFVSREKKDFSLHFNMIEIIDGTYAAIDFCDLKRIENLFLSRSFFKTKFYRSTLVKDTLNINSCDLLFSFYRKFSFILFNIQNEEDFLRFFHICSEMALKTIDFFNCT